MPGGSPVDATLDATSWPDFLAAAAHADDDVAACLCFARDFGRRLPQPGGGKTRRRWDLLTLTGAADLTTARILEAHCDALAILDEAGRPPSSGTWGVFAAEAAGHHLDWSDGRLTGTKPWCSLGDQVDFALVTAVHDGHRQLYAVDLRQPAVHSAPAEGWVARGLANVTSVALTFDGASAEPVGEPGWYLRRPGFAWGGIGVAACWYGAILALQKSLRAWAARRPEDDQLATLATGIVDCQVEVADAALATAAQQVDDGGAAGHSGELLALRVRSVVASAADVVLHQVAHSMGPAPLAFDEIHARRVADLSLYVRQHHGERDLATLGRATRDTPSRLDQLARWRP